MTSCSTCDRGRTRDVRQDHRGRSNNGGHGEQRRVQGLGAVKNDEMAFELFNKAAQMGNAYAMQNVGSMYAGGLFVKQDQSKALEWFEKSIEAGNAGALGAAGVVYFNGDGGPARLQGRRAIFSASGRSRRWLFLEVPGDNVRTGPARSGRSRKSRRLAGQSAAGRSAKSGSERTQAATGSGAKASPYRFRRRRSQWRWRRRFRQRLRQHAVLHRNSSRQPMARNGDPSAAVLAVLHSELATRRWIPPLHGMQLAFVT